MGIYIFNWKLLRKTLLADMKNADSSHDFGKDIIPALLNDEKKLCAYKYKGTGKTSERSTPSGKQTWIFLTKTMHLT